MKYFSKVFLAVFLFFVFSTSVSAENFRVAKLSVIDIPNDFSPVTVNVGINEGLCLNIPKDKTFIKGYEIEIKIPKIVATYRDSVIYSFYSDISPEPNDTVIDYSGTKVMNDTIPPRLSINLQTFIKSEEQNKSSPYSTLLPFNVSENQKNLTLRFQLAMKGVPESFLTSEFTVTIKPILKDVGLLTVNFLYPHTLAFEDLEDVEVLEDEITSEKVIEAVKPGDISLYIDDLIITDFSEPILLKTGTHHISVVSDSYRNEVRTVIINQASNTNLDIELKSIAPELIIVAPSNATVFLDDLELASFSEKIPITTGDHTVKFLLGDYELTKTIHVFNGITYEVSLLVDINVTESME